MTFLGSSVQTSGAAATTNYLIIYPPPYEPGNILIMAAIGGGSSTGSIYASPPIQWTALSASDAVLGVFYKVAQPIETAYYLPFSGQCMAAAVIVAYPASTIPSSLFASSSAGVVTYTPALPAGVTATETVVMITANQVSSKSPIDSGVYQAAENIGLPGGWAERVPAFGSGIGGGSGLTDYAVNAGVSDCLGTPPAATVTSAATSDFFTGFVVLSPTGVPPPPPPAPATVVPPPAGGPQFTAGSTPHGTAGLGDQYANLTYLISGSFSFLASKAVFRGTQSVSSQSLSASVVSNPITLDTVLEDPYGGWTGSPWYYWMPPQGVSGWFLCTGNVFTAAPATANAVNPLVATNGADNYAGSLTSNPSVSHGCGRPVIALVYLLGGVNLVQLQAVLAGGANLATSITAGQNSHLEVCWVSS